MEPAIEAVMAAAISAGPIDAASICSMPGWQVPQRGAALSVAEDALVVGAGAAISAPRCCCGRAAAGRGWCR